MTDGFENVVCAIGKSRDLEEIIIDDHEDSLEAYEQRKKKKKQEVLEEALQTKMTIKEDKVIYAQHNQGRGHGDRSYGRSRDRSSGNNEEREQTN